MEPLLMIVAFGAIMYFIMIRPQQKRMKEHQAVINALEPGTRVLLTSGMFATLRHVGERQVIAELAPGAEVTLIKGNIARVVTPEEEEFEFSDEAPDTEYMGMSADDLDPSQFNDPVDEDVEFDPRPTDSDEDPKTN